MCLNIALALTITLSIGLRNCVTNNMSYNNDNGLQMENTFDLDSVIINYWDNLKANKFKIKYSNRTIHISSLYDDFSTEIIDEGVVNKFLQYIDMFINSETEKIEFSRTKRNSIIVTDYSSIEIKVYVENIKKEDKIIIIGDDEYDIEFNPLFIEFYNFIDKLTKQNYTLTRHTTGICIPVFSFSLESSLSEIKNFYLVGYKPSS